MRQKKVAATGSNNLNWLLKNTFSFTTIQALSGAIVGLIAIFSYLTPIYHANYVFSHMGKFLVFGLLIGAISGALLALVIVGIASLYSKV